MGRGNAEARAAKVQAQLAAAAQAQAEIAKQALDAVEAGTAPDVAADLAVRAATEAGNTLKEDGTVAPNTSQEIVRDTPFSGIPHTSRKIRVKSGYSGPAFSISVNFEGASVLLFFGNNGVAETLSNVAQYMVESSPNEFEFVEE